MTTAEVSLHYQQRLAELQAALDAIQTRQWGSIAIIVLAAAIAVGASFLVYSRRSIPAWYPPLALPPIFISLRGFGLRKSKAHQLARLTAHYRQGETRLDGSWVGGGESGIEFDSTEHPYSADLNLFGAGSLFERLCTARTQSGRERIAEYLKTPADPAEAMRRQEAVQELSIREDLRESIALLGQHGFEQLRSNAFAEWLTMPTLPRATALRRVLFASCATLTCLTCALMLVPSSWRELWLPIAVLAGFHLCVGSMLLGKVRAILTATTALSTEFGVIREGLAMLSAQSFSSEKLRRLVDRAAGANERIARLDLWFFILRHRTKESWYPLCLWLLLGTQSALAIDIWRRSHETALLDWLDCWAEFEALNALGCYAFENPEDCWPSFVDGPATFNAEQLCHPLLGRESCVGNDVSLGAAANVLVISGSNMSGKSTLLRSIGLASILALAGAPVRAKSLCLAAMRTYASISVGDSLRDGKSKFMAEVERIRETLDAAMHHRVLFLIDEVFSGTNSRDRLAAADAVIRTLVERGAIGLVSTHDIALTELARHQGANLHMASRGDDPLDFDYLLKPGPTRQTNAIAIARLAGVPV